LSAESDRIEPLLSTVMRGLDPRIHLLRWIAGSSPAMTTLTELSAYGVKPGNDNRFNMTGNRW
jgi:hypothetical protein